jgi:PAS domain S-box-containing protein
MPPSHDTEAGPDAGPEAPAVLTADAIETVLGLMPVGVLLVDEGGLCTYWSPSAERMLGYPAREVLGRRVFEILERPEVPSPRPPRRSGDHGAPRDLVLRKKDGHHLHVRERVVDVEGADPSVGHLVTYEDTTDLTHQLERLALIHAISDLVQGTLKLDRLLHVILTCATAGTGLSFNRAFLFLLEEEDGHVRGAMGVGPASHEEADHVWKKLDREGLPVEGLVERYMLEGGRPDSPLDGLVRKTRIPLTDTHHPVIRAIRAEHPLVFRGADARRVAERSLSGIPLGEEFVVAPFIARDRPIGALLADNIFDRLPITADDVSALSMLAGIAGLAIANARMFQSERKKARHLEKALQDLRRAQERLIQSERLAVIGRLSAHLAHEIRNPLTTIGLYVRAVRKHWDGGDANRRKLEVALDEVAHLEEILNQVLDFARPRAPVLGDCDPAHLLEDIHRAVAQEAEGRGIRTRVSSEYGIPLRADVSQLRQVLLNLVRNALQAMRKDGELTLEARRSGDDVEFRVVDTGPGIAEEHQARIFEPFFTTRVKGSGLGLAISKKIVEDHGGRIELRSREGRGTTFIITQPLRPRATMPIPDAEVGPGPGG